MHALAEPLKVELVRQCAAIKDTRVALMLSGGFDSWSLAFAARAAGKEVIGYIFRMDGVESTDWKLANENAEMYGFKVRNISLSGDLHHLVASVRWMKAELGLFKKAEIECVYPIAETSRHVDEKHVLLGHGADDLYGTTKRAAIHFRNSLRAFRTDEFTRSQNQIDGLMKLFDGYGMTAVMPYETEEIGALFDPYDTFDSLHKPKIKQPTRDAFPEEFARIRVIRQGLQVGDSGIRNAFERLLASPYNVTKASSTVAIYNRI